MDYPEWADSTLSSQLGELRARGENQELEYMARFPQNVRDLAKEIAAFATSNQGIILLGVSDEGDLLGLSTAEQPKGRDILLRRLQGICSGVVKPAITPSARFAVEDGKPVLVITVPKGSQPIYYCHGKPYVRHITESRPAQPYEVIDLISKWLASTAGTESTEIERRSQFISSLASTLVDVLIFGAEAEERSIHPWLDMWQAQFRQAASELRDLATENPAQAPEIQKDLKDLAKKLDETGSFEMYMGSAPKLAELINQVMSTARAVKTKYVDTVPLSEGSRSDAKDSFFKLVRRLGDLSSRANGLTEQGRIDEVQAETSEIGYALLRLSAYTGAFPQEHVTDIAAAGRGLHLLETCPIFLDGGKSVASVVDTVLKASHTLDALASELKQEDT